jgi:voltage-gated potassium channel
MLREELGRLFTLEERHRRLAARIAIAILASTLVDLLASLLIWRFESGLKGGDIHGFGDAVFFATVQLLTISSSIKNPLTFAGKVVDVVLEAWAIFVVTGVAGSFAAFFSTGDAS